VRALLVLLALAAAPLARAAGDAPTPPEKAAASGGAAITFAVTAPSTLTYRLVHRFHTVEGVSKAVEGRARILPDRTVQAMVRARVDSFDSGNGNRDSDMRTATEAAKHPFVTLKAVGRLAEIASYPAERDLPLRGELTFHGRTRPLELTAKVRFETPARVRVDAAFPVSLEDFEVERPALLFVKVEDGLAIATKLTLEAER
jgi:polyisoprenoid-binding protein YceI